MAGPYHGKNGNVDFGDEIANLQSWTLNATGETSESTAMADTWAEHLAGLTDFTATCEALSQKALDTTALIGNDASLDLQIDSSDGPHFEANAILVSLTESVDFENNGTISYSFEGNDEEGLSFTASGGSAAAGNADAFHGKLCKAEFGVSPSDFTNVRGWSITLTASTADTTSAHATLAGRTKLAGVFGATATITCVADVAVQVDLGVSGVINLWRTQTQGDGVYEGTAICTGNEVGVDRDGTSIITYSFIYTGEVDLAVA